ncbi:TolB family protein, partial [Nocardioides sp.]|uniref:TolB family protein n=1 Tax=Nocardioides sp. TaxID=35761 RepID=UPI003562464E
LSPEGNNGQEQVFLRDRVQGTTTLVSAAVDGGPGDARSYRGMVSSDGRYVAFASQARNLTPETSPPLESIYLRDLQSGTTQRMSITSTGEPAKLGGSRPYLSPDGEHVIFNSFGALVPDDTAGYNDVYLVHRRTGAVERQSVSVDGGDSNGDSLRGFISDDGGTTVFNSFATTLVTNDHNSSGDVFLRDRSTGTTTMLSQSYFGGGADGQSYRPVMSDDGAVVAYLSRARNLVEGDPSSDYQVYVVETDTVPMEPDTTGPVVTADRPSFDSTSPSPVTFHGTATDDRGVIEAYIQVRDNATFEWLRPDGTWGPGARRLPAALASPGATNTEWSTTLDLPGGTYGFDVTALDAARNRPASKPWTRFHVGTPDSTPPTLSVSTPRHRDRMSSPVTFAGDAADDQGVAQVFLQVRDNATQEWLRPDGSWGPGARRLTTTLGDQGGRSTTWQHTLDLPDGDYGFDVIAMDGSRNFSDKPWSRFFVGPAEATASQRRKQSASASTAPARDPRLWPYGVRSIWNHPLGADGRRVPLGLEPPTERTLAVEEDLIVASPDTVGIPLFAHDAGWSARERCASSTGRPLALSAPIPLSWTTDPGYRGSTPNHAAAILRPDGTLLETQPLHVCEDGFAVSQHLVEGSSIRTGDTAARIGHGSHGGSGLTAFGGTIRIGEWTPEAQVIPHALKIELPARKVLSASRGGFRWPAHRADSYADRYRGSEPEARMGALVALPSDVRIGRFRSEAARVIARTLRGYGAYVVDDTARSAVALATEWGPAGRVVTEFQRVWGFPLDGELGKARGAQRVFLADMNRIYRQLEVVADNGPASIGGSGARLAPWAPALEAP